jgi:hypothetical protein
MKQSIAHWRRLAFSLSGTCLLLTACATDHEPPPIGADTGNQQPSVYSVEVIADEVDFTIGSPTQQMKDLSASVSVSDLRPVLYYRYDIQSEAIGNYLMMTPPKVYRVRREPFYRLEPATARIHLSLRNGSDEVLRTSNAAYAFEVNGHTVSSAPLSIPDLLPGHSSDVTLDGPTLDELKGVPNGTLTAWVYGIGGADKEHRLHWDISYIYSQRDYQATGEIVLTTSSEKEAESYRNREDMADPADATGGP